MTPKSPVGSVAAVEQILLNEFGTSPRVECGNIAEEIVKALTEAGYIKAPATSDDVKMVDALFSILPIDEVEVEKGAWERLRASLPAAPSLPAVDLEAIENALHAGNHHRMPEEAETFKRAFIACSRLRSRPAVDPVDPSLAEAVWAKYTAPKLSFRVGEAAYAVLKEEIPKVFAEVRRLRSRPPEAEAVQRMIKDHTTWKGLAAKRIKDLEMEIAALKSAEVVSIDPGIMEDAWGDYDSAVAKYEREGGQPAWDLVKKRRHRLEELLSRSKGAEGADAKAGALAQRSRDITTLSMVLCCFPGKLSKKLRHAIQDKFCESSRATLPGDTLEAPTAQGGEGRIPHPGKPGRWMCAGCSCDVFEATGYACPNGNCRLKQAAQGPA